MIEKPYFWDWAVFNDDAELVGIQPDAPQKAQDSYKQFLKDKEQAEKDFVKW
jgi:hypothetical protein